MENKKLGNSKLGRVYNWKPEPKDARDFQFAKLAAPAVNLPASADLRAHCPPVVDQGDLGSCTGNAIAGALGFLELKELQTANGSAGTSMEFGKTFQPLSRLFIYYNERSVEGTVSEDAGALIRDGVKSIATTGACSETTWPYNPAVFASKPSAAAYAEAATHKIANYYRIVGLQQIKQCLSQGFPVVFGFTVYESFEADSVATTGVMPFPNVNTEECMGGHAVLAVGYDDAHKWVIVRNSWGDSWGDKGYFYMPYAMFTTPDLTDDTWTIRK